MIFCEVKKMKIKKIMYIMMAVATITCTAMPTITAHAATKAEYIASGLDDATSTMLAAADARKAGTITADQCEAIFESYGTFDNLYPPFVAAEDTMTAYTAKYPDAAMDVLNDGNCINKVYTMGTYLCQQLDAGTITQKQCAYLILHQRTDNQTAAQNLATAQKTVAKYAAKNAKTAKAKAKK